MADVLQRYLDGLHRGDSHFRKFWGKRSSAEQHSYIARWQTCNQVASLPEQELQGRQESAYLETRRWFSLVHEIGFSYSRIPDNWTLVAGNRSCQYRIFKRNRDDLHKFLNDLELGEFKLYGGVKPLASIRQKALGTKDGTAVQRNVLDLWDLIRFRICTANLFDLLKVGVTIWDRYFANVIRCRNYYFYPRGGNPADGYRALHFELLDGKGGMFEVQAMTAYREAVCLLDHAPRFKQVLHFLDAGHESWLTRMSAAANVIEFEKEDLAPLKTLLGRK